MRKLSLVKYNNNDDDLLQIFRVQSSLFLFKENFYAIKSTSPVYACIFAIHGHLSQCMEMFYPTTGPMAVLPQHRHIRVNCKLLLKSLQLMYSKYSLPGKINDRCYIRIFTMTNNYDEEDHNIDYNDNNNNSNQ